MGAQPRSYFRTRRWAGPDPETSHLAALAKLGELHSQDVLTDTEFAAEKTRLIGQ
jgi:hypothetical protein